MGVGVLSFSQANPAQSPGYIAAVDALGKAIDEALGLEIKQRDGILGERAGSARRRELRDRMHQIHLRHLTSAGRRAQREQPEIQKLFRYKPAGGSFGAFRAAGASMVEAAQSHQDVLVRHGMDDAVVKDLIQALAEFDAISEQCTAARTAHVGASARLRALGQEVVELVRVIDGLNRIRFKDDDSLLAQWISLSTLRAAPRDTAADDPAGPVAAPPVAPQADRPAA
jgi:hypothetical protein